MEEEQIQWISWIRQPENMITAVNLLGALYFWKVSHTSGK